MSRLPFAIDELVKAAERVSPDKEPAKIFIGLSQKMFEAVRDDLESHNGQPFATRTYIDHGTVRIAVIDPRDFYT